MEFVEDFVLSLYCYRVLMIILLWYVGLKQNKKTKNRPFYHKNQTLYDRRFCMDNTIVCFNASVQVLVKSGFTVFDNVPTY